MDTASNAIVARCHPTWEATLHAAMTTSTSGPSEATEVAEACSKWTRTDTDLETTKCTCTVVHTTKWATEAPITTTGLHPIGAILLDRAALTMVCVATTLYLLVITTMRDKRVRRETVLHHIESSAVRDLP